MMKKLNTQLMNEKADRDKAEADAEMKFANALIKRTNDEIQAEKDKNNRRRNDALAYKKKLVQQLADERLQAQREATDLAVSKTERAMNSKLFSKLHEDSELIGKINEKYTTAASTARTQRDGGGVASLMAHENLLVTGKGRGGRRKGGSPNKRAGGNRRVVPRR